MKQIDYPAAVLRLVNSAERANAAFIRKATFGGPSLHFHRRALAAALKNCEAFAEASYAMLIAWGMHRMGRGGPKMDDFPGYLESLQSNWMRIVSLQKKSPADLTKADWTNLCAAFYGIKVMKTDTILVANSKVLAHALPNLVVPIDRTYTLKYLRISTVNNSPEWQWGLFRDLHEQFFYPIASSSKFKKLSSRWIGMRVDRPWNTSVLKIIDNCIIGAAPQRMRK